MHPTVIGWGALGAVLVLAGWLVHRRRFDRYRASDPIRLDDDLVRRIERDGVVDLDDPTDPEEVAAEEERFWSESWDRPEEW